jgi:hypothetical protein
MPAMPRDAAPAADFQRTLRELDTVLRQLADLLQAPRSGKAEAPVLARRPT